MRVVGYSSWAPDERANAIRLAFPALREKTGLDWSLEHYGAGDFNDPGALGRLRESIRQADILIGWQSMSIETVERMASLLTEMDAAGELGHLKFLWYDIPDPRLQRLMFKSWPARATKRPTPIGKPVRAFWACRRWSSPPP